MGNVDDKIAYEARWQFPRAKGGRSHGFKDAGTATFSGKVMASLVREICQNSLDAADGSGRPVQVEFERHQLCPELLPDFSGLTESVQQAASYWKSKENEDVLEHLQRVNELLTDTDTVPVLRASDYRTTGLRSAYQDRIGEWSSLTKFDGGATKSGTSAGSYGIGKNAPFAASELRMVFYRTLTEEEPGGVRAAQGIFHLPAYPTDKEHELSTQTLGVGYLGNPAEDGPIQNLPVPVIPLLDQMQERTEVGSDVFVFAFREGKNWMDDVAAELLESFLLAFHYGRLEVDLINGSKRVSITTESLPRIIERYARSAKNAFSYHKILAAPQEVDTFEYDFHGMGMLKLRLLAQPDSALNRKVLVTRASHMKIRAIDRISKNMKFTGILELEGEELNRYFRALETPAHDGWEADRYTQNPKQAKEYIKELRTWVVQCVNDAAALTTEDQMRVTGLSRNLRAATADNADSTGRPMSDEMPDSDGPSISITMGSNRSGARSRGANAAIRRSGAEHDANGSSGVLDGAGNTPYPRKKRKKAPKNLRRTGRGSAETAAGKSGGTLPQALDVIHARIIQTGRCSGRLLLTVPEDIERGTIMVHIVGENGSRYEGLGIQRASAISDEIAVHAAGNRIRFENLPGRKRVVADIDFAQRVTYALGVSVYEDR